MFLSHRHLRWQTPNTSFAHLLLISDRETMYFPHLMHTWTGSTPCFPVSLVLNHICNSQGALLLWPKLFTLSYSPFIQVLLWQVHDCPGTFFSCQIDSFWLSCSLGNLFHASFPGMTNALVVMTPKLTHPTLEVTAITRTLKKDDTWKRFFFFFLKNSC